jgi:hypothetical protein
VVVGAAVLVGGCGGSSGGGKDEAKLKAGAVWVAEVKPARVKVREYQDGGKSQELHNPDLNGTPLTFLVDGKKIEEDWVKVHLPVRPNGTKGWVKRSDLRFSQVAYDIAIDLSDRELTVTKDGKEVLSSPIAIGQKSTPTPEGFFYVRELIKPEQPDTIYGAYAYGLSGHSEVIEPTWDETEGAIAIHGTNDPDGIGKAISNGCIRVPDEVVTEMTTFLPLGTPVTIEE